MTEITIEKIESLTGATLLEFGASWCGHCQNAQSDIASALNHFPNIQHIKIEDGKGKRLGRLYLVKLWPTLIFLKNGKEIKRLVRPENAEQITDALNEIDG